MVFSVKTETLAWLSSATFFELREFFVRKSIKRDLDDLDNIERDIAQLLSIAQLSDLQAALLEWLENEKEKHSSNIDANLFGMHKKIKLPHGLDYGVWVKP